MAHASKNDRTPSSSFMGSDLEEELFLEYEQRNWRFAVGNDRWGLRVNPVSFVASVLAIWGFVAWAMIQSDEASRGITIAQEWITHSFTWIYMATQQIWVIFLIVVFFSRLGRLKLGKPGDEPEFPAASWFMMVFSAGVGIGLFFFSVAEPVWHYEPCLAVGGPPAGPGSNCYGNRYSSLPDDERAQWAMFIGFFHWGIHGWICYLIVALVLSTVVYRRGLPMTMKSAFYPILGDKIFGWMGDAIDVISVATTIFGICTTLGLGVQQMNAGFSRLNSDIPQSTSTQVVIIWCITAAATVSVVTGIRLGIRRLSELNWTLIHFIALIVLFQGDTWYLLNTIVQSLGFYTQWLVQLGTWCDAFSQAVTKMVPTPAGPVEVTSTAPDGTSADPEWMNDWTIFYWGWWIAWSPFVGMFIAKISRGRTVRQVVMGALSGPVLYSIFWFGVFGGTGLRIERQAANLGVTCADNPPVLRIGGLEYWRLSCRDTQDQFFDMLANFPMSNFYWALSLASLILLFVTSSDSASLVVDCLTSNGNPDPPIPQRIFWSATEGAVATALVLAGSDDAITSLRGVSIIAGVPYTVVLCVMCKSLWDMLSEEADAEQGIVRPKGAPWAVGIVDVLDPPTFSRRHAATTAASVFVPWLYGGAGAAWATGVPNQVMYVVYALLFYAWPALLVGNTGQPGTWAIAWTSYLAFVTHLGFARSEARSKRGIKGDLAADLALAVLGYPFVCAQLYAEMKEQPEETSDTPSAAGSPPAQEVVAV